MLPTLKIIVYTDCQSIFNENPISPRGSLSDFKAFTRYKIEDLVDVKFCFVNRHSTNPQTGKEIHAGQKVTCDLLKDTDEFWVFGRRKINNDTQPENELDKPELDALDAWMTTKKGGVFVTGDHSEPDETLHGPPSCKADHKTFLSLGRALGSRIPRAHQLRDWEGPPTNCNEAGIPLPDRDNFNTQEGAEPDKLDDPLLESDKTPQNICLTLKDSQPHRLFWYFDPDGTFRPIDKLPDHPHEGYTLAPDKLDGEWPPKSLPPEIVAHGRDKRFPNENRVGGLVTAFDGDSAGIGRIVVDSSFHHYLNYNLMGIPDRDVHSKLPLPKTELDQIAQFFGNLALWLAPKHIRDKIKIDLLLSLARDPSVLETRGHSVFTVGQVSRVVLKATIKEARLNWLFAPSQFETWDYMDEFYRTIFLNEDSTEPIAQDFLLGAVISVCQAYLSNQLVADVTRFAGAARVGEVLPQKLMALVNRKETDMNQFLEELKTGLFL